MNFPLKAFRAFARILPNRLKIFFIARRFIVSAHFVSKQTFFSSLVHDLSLKYTRAQGVKSGICGNLGQPDKWKSSDCKNMEI